jgi:hypothetical protein
LQPRAEHLREGHHAPALRGGHEARLAGEVVLVEREDVADEGVEFTAKGWTPSDARPLLLNRDETSSLGKINPSASMRVHACARWLTAVALVASSMFTAAAVAQTFFYSEVAKDGRIYVFALSSRYDAFIKSDGAETGPVIERRGYGPSGETVVFDSEDAINLYNFKHGLPGEHFPAREERPASQFPSNKFSGLMFGDYYWYYERHQDGVSSTNPTPVEGQHGLWFRRLYFTYDFAHNEKLSTRFRLEANSNGEFEGGDIVPYVKDAYVRWAYKGRQQLTLGIHPTLTFDWLDEFWGLRHIEKTPADLYRLDSSRDFGFTFQGSPRVHDLSYAVQFGNASGNGSETREGKILRFEGRYQRRSAVALEASTVLAPGPPARIVRRRRASPAFNATRYEPGCSTCGKSARLLRILVLTRRSTYGLDSSSTTLSPRKRICSSAWTRLKAISAAPRPDCRGQKTSTTGSSAVNRRS